MASTETSEKTNVPASTAEICEVFNALRDYLYDIRRAPEWPIPDYGKLVGPLRQALAAIFQRPGATPHEIKLVTQGGDVFIVLWIDRTYVAPLLWVEPEDVYKQSTVSQLRLSRKGTLQEPTAPYDADIVVTEELEQKAWTALQEYIEAYSGSYIARLRATRQLALAFPWISDLPFPDKRKSIHAQIAENCNYVLSFGPEGPAEVECDKDGPIDYSGYAPFVSRIIKPLTSPTEELQRTAGKVLDQLPGDADDHAAVQREIRNAIEAMEQTQKVSARCVNLIRNLLAGKGCDDSPGDQ